MGDNLFEKIGKVAAGAATIGAHVAPEDVGDAAGRTGEALGVVSSVADLFGADGTARDSGRAGRRMRNAARTADFATVNGGGLVGWLSPDAQDRGSAQQQSAPVDYVPAGFVRQAHRANLQLAVVAMIEANKSLGTPNQEAAMQRYVQQAYAMRNTPQGEVALDEALIVTLDRGKPTEKTITVPAGTYSVGALTEQLAKGLGYENTLQPIAQGFQTYQPQVQTAAVTPPPPAPTAPAPGADPVPGAGQTPGRGAENGPLQPLANAAARLNDGSLSPEATQAALKEYFVALDDLLKNSPNGKVQLPQSELRVGNKVVSLPAQEYTAVLLNEQVIAQTLIPTNLEPELRHGAASIDDVRQGVAAELAQRQAAVGATLQPAAYTPPPPVAQVTTAALGFEPINLQDGATIGALNQFGKHGRQHIAEVALAALGETVANTSNGDINPYSQKAVAAFEARLQGANSGIKVDGMAEKELLAELGKALTAKGMELVQVDGEIRAQQIGQKQPSLAAGMAPV